VRRGENQEAGEWGKRSGKRKWELRTKAGDKYSPPALLRRAVTPSGGVEDVADLQSVSDEEGVKERTAP
jgi:hypothetical protein